jgi:O-antigen ligase
MARLLSVLMARDYFLQYPVLGLGWGSVTSDDLVFKILSNTGIAGLLAFCLFVVSVFVHLWKSARRARANSDLSFVAVSMIVVFSVLIFTNATSGFAYAYSHVWLIFGLAMSVPGFCFGSRIEKPLPSLVSPNTAVVA